MASHDFNNGNRLFVVVDGSVNCNFPYRRSYIFRSTSVARCMVCFYKVIVDSFWNTDKTDITIDSVSVADNLLTVSIESFPPM